MALRKPFYVLIFPALYFGVGVLFRGTTRGNWSREKRVPRGHHAGNSPAIQLLAGKQLHCGVLTVIIYETLGYCLAREPSVSSPTL